MGTFWIWLAICGLFTFFYFRQKWNVLLAIITAISYIGLSIYVLNYPPTNVTAGTLLHQILILIFAGAGISMFIMWFRNRDRFIDENGKSELTEEQQEERRLASKSPMQMSENEYKAYLRSRRQRVR